MVAILEKGEHNIDFYPMVDFVEASSLRYALTFKPPIYVSHIRQFWSTARIETAEEGTKILATVDGILQTVTESSLRRNLKLQDEEGISSLPDTELFENLSLMGYNISQNKKFTFQKGQFSHQWKYLIHTIMQCLSPKCIEFNVFISNIATALVCLATNMTYIFSKMTFNGLVKNINNKGEGSGTPTKPHHIPSPEAQPSSHTHIFSPSLPTVTSISTAPIPTVTPSETTPLRQYTRRVRIAQSFALSSVADEPASLVRDVSQWEAYPTESGFIADQDRTTIAKSSTLPHDSATRVTSFAAAQEVEINKLKERVKLLEDGKGMVAEGSRDDAPIKGRRLDEDEVATERVSSDIEEIRLDEGEVAAEKVSDDTEEMATVLITMDAASVLSSGGVQVVPTTAAVAPSNVSISTGSGVVPTVSTTISTATPIFATATTVTPYTMRKGKEKMVETHTPKKKKRMIAGLDRSNETIAKHLEEYDQAVAELIIGERIELISEFVKYQDHYSNILKYQAQQRKSRTKKQKIDFYMAVIKNNLGWKVKDFKEMSFEEVEAKFKTVWEQIKGGVSKISKGEAAWLKRKGIISKQESAKKQKTTEEVPKEVKSCDEIPKLLELMLSKRSRKNTKCVNVADEELTAAKHKLMLLVVSATKLPILNPNVFDLWKMRIEQYFLMTDYTFWEVILNGDSHVPTRTDSHNIAFVSSTPTDSTTDLISATVNVSAVGTKLTASTLPNVDSLSNAMAMLTMRARRTAVAEPQRRNVPVETSTSNALVSQCDEKHFKGNTKTKKVQKTLLKQQFKNFSGSSSEGLDQIHDRLQKLVSQLEIHGVSLSQEDVNLKFLRSTESHNLAFVSSTPIDSTNDLVSAAVTVSAIGIKLSASTLPNVDSLSNAIDVDDLEEMDLKWQMAMLTMRARMFLQKTGRNLGTNGPTSMGFDMAKLSPTKPEQDLSSRPSAPIIKDWVSGSEEDDMPQAPIPVAPSVPIRANPHSKGSRRTQKACFICKSMDHLIKDCNFHARKLAHRTYSSRDIHKQYAPVNHSKFPLHKISAAAPSKSQSVLTTANRTKPFTPSLISSNSPPRVTAAKASAGNPKQALKDKGVIDKGSDFEELNGGYVAFGGNPKGGKITGKGKIKTGKLDFDDVYFVKELKFNLFSVSQMCDKKNSVLFIDTKCLVLSFDFKFLDASHLLLRVPRENNMYNVNLRNIVPSRDLTCLFAKATLDESNLWHRRLGHVNFKTINKLV
nr:ribonuclease H-like domain-containing protein [Tanacetum cinerariifolium]